MVNPSLALRRAQHNAYVACLTLESIVALTATLTTATSARAYLVCVLPVLCAELGVLLALWWRPAWQRVSVLALALALCSATAMVWWLDAHLAAPAWLLAVAGVAGLMRVAHARAAEPLMPRQLPQALRAKGLLYAVWLRVAGVVQVALLALLGVSEREADA